jgi:hypothetical protein
MTASINENENTTMKTTDIPNLLVAALIASLALATAAYAQTGKTVNTRIGKLSFTYPFPSGYPTTDSVEKLFDERDWQRACQI